MEIKPFLIESWMNDHEERCTCNIAETCVDPISLDELFYLTGTDKDKFINELSSRRLTYGTIEGSPELKRAVCGQYPTVEPRDIVTTHGAAGANHLVFYSLISHGDHVVCVHPTYQQLYSIAESFGADVEYLHLKPEDNFLPDVARLRKMVTESTRMICINNPNNPTGALIPNNMLREIVDVAKSADAYLLCDEVYRNLNQSGEYTESVADLYGKGISVCGMSKIFSLAGLRLGWIATKNREIKVQISSHRDYNHISCGMLDEAVASLALTSSSLIIARSRKIVVENLMILDNWVKNEPHISYVKPEAGTTALLFYDMDITSYAFCERFLDETGVLLSPGSSFGLEYCVRIGYAFDKTSLVSGLAALKQYLYNLDVPIRRGLV